MSDHYTILRSVPTISVQFLSLCSKQFCLNKKGFPTKMIFVVFEGSDTSTLLGKLIE